MNKGLHAMTGVGPIGESVTRRTIKPTGLSQPSMRPAPGVPAMEPRSTATKATSLQHNAAPWGRTSNQLAPPGELTGYKPAWERMWVRGPKNVQATVGKRADWFRVMQCNMMADTWTQHDKWKGTKFERTRQSNRDLKIKLNTTPEGQELHGGGELSVRGRLGERLPDGMYQRVESRVEEIEEGTQEEEGEQGEGEGEGGEGGSTASSSSPGGAKLFTPLEGDPTPEWLTWEHRLKQFKGEVDFYDPDLISMNEVSRAHFNGAMWKHLRSLGYGAMFTSGFNANGRFFRKVLGRGETHFDYTKHTGDESKDKITQEDDIGNAIFYHRSRFIPVAQPGIEYPNYLPFVSMGGMKDRVTGQSVLLCNVNLHQGSGPAAVKQREQEVLKLWKVLELNNDTSDRHHQVLMVMGDLNVEDEEEPAINLIRERMASAYDVCGGPTWTTWHHKTEPTKEAAALLLKEAGVEKVGEKKLISDQKSSSGVNVKDLPPAAHRGTQHQGALENLQVEEEGGGTKSEVAVVAKTTKALTAGYRPIQSAEDAAMKDPKDALELSLDQERAVLLSKGVVKRTSDYMFYDSSHGALIQALDVPKEDFLLPQTLLPCPDHPFHHVSMVADFCYLDYNPDTAPPIHKNGVFARMHAGQNSRKHDSKE